MTDSNYTAVAVLLDRSGSMRQIKNDAEGGLQHFIDEQRKLPGKCTLRVARFDHEYQTLYPSTPISDAAYPNLDPRGQTALLDSWGRLMTEFGEELSALPEQERPGHVVFVVITDGFENASREWTREHVFEKVKEQTDKFGWEFIYLGANQDAVATGTHYGVYPSHTMTYGVTGQEVHSAYTGMSGTVSRSRAAGGQSAGFTDEERSEAEVHCDECGKPAPGHSVRCSRASGQTEGDV